MPGEKLAPTHPARVLAQAVERLDLTAFTEGAKAVEGHAGRPRTSPKLLLSLWLYGLTRGVGEACELARRAQQEEAFIWLCGGVEVSHDALSGFLVEHQGALEGLFTQVVGLLLQHGLVTLEHVAQDGTRVRASAGAPSFRSATALKECEEQARAHLHAVLAQADDPELSSRQRAAREAAARDYLARVDKALEQLSVREKENAARKKSDRAKGKLRTSTTDPQARVMKMPDGGFRPAYNVQLAVAGNPEGGPRTIVGVHVTNAGTDAGSLAPMLQQVQRRCGQLPEKLLADGGHACLEDLKACAARQVEAYVAVPERMAKAGAQGDHSPEVADWRERMAGEQGQLEYRGRAGLVENVNAQVKERYGLTQFTVRGLPKVTCVALMVCLAHNLATHGSALLEVLG
jgi:transposase